MTRQEKGIEIKVGLFVFVGLLFIAGMVLKFGSVGQSFKKYYSLRVEFPNADGLIKGADVLLAGAKVGFVAEKPAISSNVSSVVIALNIEEGVRIPRATKFKISMSGLLGDRYVEVVPNEGFTPATFDPNDPAQSWRAGELIQGTREGGLEALTKKGEATMDDLRGQLAELKELTARLRTGVLSESNLKNLDATFTNLKDSSANFVEASKNVNTVVQNAQGAVDSAKQTMSTTDAAAADLRVAIADARKLIESTNTVIKRANTGQGLLPTLLSNPKIAEDFSALLGNLRRHGVLFYRDSSQRAETEPPRRTRQ